MGNYINDIFITELLYDNEIEIELFFASLQSLNRMKKSHIDFVVDNVDTIEDCKAALINFYKENGNKISFDKPSKHLKFEDIFKPFLEALFLDLYQIAIIKDKKWEYKFINYNQLLSVADTVKTFNFGIDKIKIEPEHRKKFTIAKVTQYAYWICWAIFNATKYWAAHVIPSKITFQENTYGDDGIPANLCILQFRTIIELTNKIHHNNELSINEFQAKNSSKNFDHAITFAKNASKMPLSIEPIYYMDDVKHSVNHAIVPSLKANFKKTDAVRSEILPYIAAQTLVFFINGVQIATSMLPNYADLIWQKSQPAKKSVYENILNCFYYQDIFDFVIHFFQQENWKEINNCKDEKIAELFKNNASVIAESFHGELLEKWLGEVIHKMNSAHFYSAPIGLMASKKGIGSQFVITEATFNENKALAKNNMIIEDQASRIYNMMQAMISGVTEFRGFTALRQTTISGHAIRCFVLFTNLVKGSLLALNQLLDAKRIAIEFNAEKLLDMMLETSVEEKIILAAYTEEYIGKLSMSKIATIALSLVERYIELELLKPDNEKYRGLVFKALKIKQSEMHTFFTSNNFMLTSAFGFAIERIVSNLDENEMKMLTKFQIDKEFHISTFEQYLEPSVLETIIEKRQNGIIEIYSFVNNLVLKRFFDSFMNYYFPIHQKVKDPNLLKTQTDLLGTTCQPTFSILGQIAGEFSHRHITQIVTTTDSLVQFIKRCFDYARMIISIQDKNLTFQQKDIIDLGFKNRLDGTSLVNKLPKFGQAAKSDEKKYWDFNDYNKSIAKFNKEQIELLKAYKEMIPAIKDAGYLSSNGALIQKPIVILNSVNNYLQIHDLISEIEEFNNEQETLLYNDIDRLTPIADLGFHHSIDGLKIKHPYPNRNDFSLTTIFDLQALHEKIILFNNEQKAILESYKASFPAILNYGFLSGEDGEFIDESKRVNEYDLVIENYNDYKAALKKVTIWNDYQEALLKQYLDNLPATNDYGFDSYYNGEVIKHPKPLSDFALHSGAINLDSEKFYAWRKDILLFNNEQDLILQQHIHQLPKIEDLGFVTRFNKEPLTYLKPVALSEIKDKLVNKIAIAKYHNDISNFNDEQNNELQKAIKALEPITNINLLVDENGDKIKLKRPILIVQNIRNVSDLEDLATTIRAWNEYQEGTLRKILKKTQDVYDLGFRKDDLDIALTHPIPDLNNIEDKIFTYEEWEKINHEIDFFNAEQKKALDHTRFILPSPLNLGFNEADGATIPPLDANYEKLVVNRESFIKMREYIEAFNAEQKNLLNRKIATLPAIKNTHFEVNLTGSPVKHSIPVFISSEIKSKQDYLDQLRLIEVYNEEQSVIEENQKHYLPKILSKEFSQYPDGSPLTVQRPVFDENSITNTELKALNQEIRKYNNEQTIIFESWIAKVPSTIDLGFDANDGIDIPKPVTPDLGTFTNEQLFVELIEAITKWNSAQQQCLDHALSQIPEILDIDLLKDNGKKNRKIPRPNLDFVKSNKYLKKQNVIDIIRDIQAYNTEQKEIMVSIVNDYLDKELFDAGIVTRLDGTELNYPLPITSFADLKTNRDINDYLQGLYAFSKEQRALLDEFIRLNVPEVKDLGFRFAQQINNEIKEESVLHDISKIKNIREAEFIAKEIKRFNLWQQQLLARNIKLLDSIQDIGFKQRTNGARLIHEIPITDPYGIRNDFDYNITADAIKAYNNEQISCLEVLKQSIPKIEDFKLYDDEAAIKKPVVQQETELNTKEQVESYIEYIVNWNKKQRENLKKK